MAAWRRSPNSVLGGFYSKQVGQAGLVSKCGSDPPDAGQLAGLPEQLYFGTFRICPLLQLTIAGQLELPIKLMKCIKLMAWTFEKAILGQAMWKWLIASGIFRAILLFVHRYGGPTPSGTNRTISTIQRTQLAYNISILRALSSFGSNLPPRMRWLIDGRYMPLLHTL